eukprot:g4292.t1
MKRHWESNSRRDQYDRHDYNDSSFHQEYPDRNSPSKRQRYEDESHHHQGGSGGSHSNSSHRRSHYHRNSNSPRRQYNNSDHRGGRDYHDDRYRSSRGQSRETRERPSQDYRHSSHPNRSRSPRKDRRNYQNDDRDNYRNDNRDTYYQDNDRGSRRQPQYDDRYRSRDNYPQNDASSNATVQEHPQQEEEPVLPVVNELFEYPIQLSFDKFLQTMYQNNGSPNDAYEEYKIEWEEGFQEALEKHWTKQHAQQEWFASLYHPRYIQQNRLQEGNAIAHRFQNFVQQIEANKEEEEEEEEAK